MSHSPAPDVTVRPMQDSDWPEVQRIYSEGIASGQATFEAWVPGWRHFDHSRLAVHGFRAMGRREKIARMAHCPAAGQWRDTVLIERRTPVL